MRRSASRDMAAIVDCVVFLEKLPVGDLSGVVEAARERWSSASLRLARTSLFGSLFCARKVRVRRMKAMTMGRVLLIATWVSVFGAQPDPAAKTWRSRAAWRPAGSSSGSRSSTTSSLGTGPSGGSLARTGAYFNWGPLAVDAFQMLLNHHVALASLLRPHEDGWGAAVWARYLPGPGIPRSLPRA